MANSNTKSTHSTGGSQLTECMKQQIADCKALKARGQTYQQMRANGYAERAIMIAFERDPESFDPLKGAGEAGE